MRERDYIRGQIVFKEGKPADQVYIVVSGEFEMVKKLAKADRRRQAYLSLPKY